MMEGHFLIFPEDSRENLVAYERIWILIKVRHFEELYKYSKMV